MPGRSAHAVRTAATGRGRALTLARVEPGTGRPDGPRPRAARHHTNEYGHLAPLLAEYAATAPGDPRRLLIRILATLRTRIGGT